MPDSKSPEVALSATRIRRKTRLALAATALIPFLVLVYMLHVHVIPRLDGKRERMLAASLEGLVLFTGLLTAAGSYMIWDVARAVARSAAMVAATRKLGELEERGDEVGTMMSSSTRMLAIIEQQATEINTFAARLESTNRELEATNARLKDFSFKDDLTGLYNRRFFSIRLDDELSRYRRFNHPVSMVLLDVDGFKEVNDELGHAAGDETLREVGQLLLKHSRGINLIARYGGDEFAVLLVETAKAGARAYAQRLREVLGRHVFAHGRQLTASFGIASVPEDVTAPADEVIRAADDALYTAKRGGKNTVAGHEPAPVHIKTEKKVP